MRGGLRYTLSNIILRDSERRALHRTCTYHEQVRRAGYGTEFVLRIKMSST